MPIPVAATTRALFRGLSRARGRRIFHPHGVGFEAELRIEENSHAAGAALLGTPKTLPAIVRLSRAAGLPQAVPDALGVAVRIVDAHGPGADQDFLLVSSGRAPVLRHGLIPAPRGFSGHFFSTLLPYRIGEAIRIVGASVNSANRPLSYRLDTLPEEAPGTVFALCLASLTGSWHQVGLLRIGEIINPAQTEAIRFNPWNTGGGIRPTGPLMGLRAPAYAGSQEGRSA